MKNNYGKECTIICYVEDLKMLHVDSNIVSSILDDIDAEYGEIVKMTITGGKDTQIPRDDHQLLLARQSNILCGLLNCKYSRWHTIRYEGGIINTGRTPYFWYCRRCEQNIPNQRRHFSSLLVQILYLSKRELPYIQLAVSFLCTRSIEPETYYCNNLEILVKYIQGTIVLPLILSIEKSGNIKWCVYTEFAVHKYMGSHTGGFMTIVTVGVYVKSSKQKLNTNSSTETDLVRVDGFLTQVIWTQ